jgi:hypothetical protein
MKYKTMPHGYCRPRIFLPPDSITLLLPITANGTLSWNINKILSKILCVTWTIFSKIWYLFLYMPIPYPFALKMFKYIPWQGKWFLLWNTRGEGWGPIYQFNLATFLCLSQARNWISKLICRLLCMQWVQLRW